MASAQSWQPGSRACSPSGPRTHCGVAGGGDVGSGRTHLPIGLERGIDKDVETAVETTKNQAKELETRDQIPYTTTMSAGDPKSGSDRQGDDTFGKES
jgi:hypothetical protein